MRTNRQAARSYVSHQEQPVGPGLSKIDAVTSWIRRASLSGGGELPSTSTGGRCTFLDDFGSDAM